MPRQNQFRIQSKQLFLTYSQCPLDGADVANRLTNLLTPYGIICSRVGTEQHQDGGNHLHCFFKLNSRFETRNQRFFDLDDYHPNIVSAIRDSKATWDYCGKDGNTIDVGTGPQDTINKWLAVVQAPTKEAAMELALEASPKDYVLQHERLEYFINKHFQQGIPEYQPTFTEFVIPQELTDWVDQMQEVSIRDAALGYNYSGSLTRALGFPLEVWGGYFLAYSRLTLFYQKPDLRPGFCFTLE